MRGKGSCLRQRGIVREVEGAIVFTNLMFAAKLSSRSAQGEAFGFVLNMSIADSRKKNELR
jgi:hypothetical protein